MPDYLAHAKALADEIEASKDRVRNLSRHWATDGEHKEQCIRDVLRRRLPQRYIVGHGFILTGDSTSTQIDILVVDGERPIVSRDANDGMYVTPDAVKAIVEVKTRLRSRREYAEALEKLSANVEMCLPYSVWSGLFVMEDDDRVGYWDGRPDDELLLAADESADHPDTRVNCIALGPDLFVRYWSDSKREADGEIDGPAWHSYKMMRLAPAYFVGNLVGTLAKLPPEFMRVWFPAPNGKESFRRWYLSPGTRRPTLFSDWRRRVEENGFGQLLSRVTR